MALTHEDRIVLALERVAALEEHATEFNAMGVPVEQAIHQIALSIQEEERREGDGCLDRLEKTGTLSVRRVRPDEAASRTRLGVSR